VRRERQEMPSGMEERPLDDSDNASKPVSESTAGGNSDRKAGLNGHGPSLSLPAQATIMKLQL
jgi:hypothetical protein